MDSETVERARRRLVALSDDTPRETDLQAALDRARQALESLAARSAELEETLPTRVSAALQDGLRAEVLPVARHLAEVRGLAAQTIRRLESLETTLDAERRARVEDLALLVDLVTSGWRGVERRLDRIERSVDRVERGLAERDERTSALRPV